MKIFCAALGLLLAVTAAAAAEGDCEFQDGTYENGQIFTPSGSSKCFKYKCTDGSVSIIEAGCEYNNECMKPGDTILGGCTTYRCDLEDNVYKTNIEKIDCTDVNGDCHEPGSTFSYMIDNQIYNSCTCARNPGNQISYSC